MRFFLITLIIALLAVYVSAVAPQKAVIVSFPNNTPGSVIQKAMKAVTDEGGVITHEYKLIKAFACKAADKTLEVVSAMGTEYPPTIEEDQIITANGEVVQAVHS